MCCIFAHALSHQCLQTVGCHGDVNADAAILRVHRILINNVDCHNNAMLPLTDQQDIVIMYCLLMKVTHRDFPQIEVHITSITVMAI